MRILDPKELEGLTIKQAMNSTLTIMVVHGPCFVLSSAKELDEVRRRVAGMGNGDVTILVNDALGQYEEGE